MKIPEGYTESQVVEIINRVAARLASTFKFGYHEIDDMKQQAALFAWEGIDKYDGVRPLENFLWVHVRNRLYNFKRNNYARPDKPCYNCPLNAYVDGQCTAYDNVMDCEFYEKWHNRNEVKKSLMSTKESMDIHGDKNTTVEDEVFGKHIYQIVDKEIPANLREDWIRFANKLKLPKNKRLILIEKIKEILEGHGIVT